MNMEPADPHDALWCQRLYNVVLIHQQEYVRGSNRKPPKLFDRSRGKLEIEEWMELLQSEFYRRIAWYRDERAIVSVVWVGYDRTTWYNDPPLIYEVTISAPAMGAWDAAYYRDSTDSDALTRFSHILHTLLGVPTDQEVQRAVKSMKGMLNGPCG